MTDTTRLPLADDAEIQALIALDTTGTSVEHFFKNPEQSAYTISPDGQFIAWLAPFEKRMNVFVHNRATNEVRRLTSITERDIPGYFWAGAERIVFTLDNSGDENFHVHSVHRDGTESRNLTPFNQVKAEIIDDLRDVDGEIIVGLNKRNPALFEPYRLHLDTGELTLLAENTDPANPITSWVADHDGHIRSGVRMQDGVNVSLIYRDSPTDAFRVLQTVDYKNTLSPLFFTFNNQQLYVATNVGRETTVVARYDPTTAAVVETLFEHPENDVSDLHYSHKRKVLTAASYTSWKRELVFFDDVSKNRFATLQELLPGYEIVLTSHDRDEVLYVVRTYSDRSLGAYYLYDSTTKSLTKLADVYPGIDENEMASMKPISYTSRDGLTIHGYLTLPRGVESQNLPVVVNPHGGPWYRDTWGYNPQTQLFANRGYAVLQMNFRGSTGYGRTFWERSFKQWGGTMQDDITDGVQWLIGEGIADPSRIAIYGGSYGGYATLAGVTFTPSLYKCAIDYVGVSNLFTFLETIPPYWKPYLEMMYEMVGHPVADKDRMYSQSPVFHVDKITSPLFIVQGAKDPRVNINESDQIVSALRSHGINVPYLVKENEGHGFSNEENKFEFYKAACGFLKKHLG